MSMFAGRYLDEKSRTALRLHPDQETRAVRLPKVVWEVIERMATEHRDKTQPRNKGRRAETSWVVAHMLLENLKERGLMTTRFDGTVKVVNDIDDLLG